MRIKLLYRYATVVNNHYNIIYSKAYRWALAVCTRQKPVMNLEAVVVADRGVTNIVERCRNKNAAALDGRNFMRFSYKT